MDKLKSFQNIYSLGNYFGRNILSKQKDKNKQKVLNELEKANESPAQISSLAVEIINNIDSYIYEGSDFKSDKLMRIATPKGFMHNYFLYKEDKNSLPILTQVKNNLKLVKSFKDFNEEEKEAFYDYIVYDEIKNIDNSHMNTKESMVNRIKFKKGELTDEELKKVIEIFPFIEVEKETNYTITSVIPRASKKDPNKQINAVEKLVEDIDKDFEEIKSILLEEIKKNDKEIKNLTNQEEIDKKISYRNKLNYYFNYQPAKEKIKDYFNDKLSFSESLKIQKYIDSLKNLLRNILDKDISVNFKPRESTKIVINYDKLLEFQTEYSLEDLFLKEENLWQFLKEKEISVELSQKIIFNFSIDITSFDLKEFQNHSILKNVVEEGEKIVAFIEPIKESKDIDRIIINQRLGMEFGDYNSLSEEEKKDYLKVKEILIKQYKEFIGEVPLYNLEITEISDKVERKKFVDNLLSEVYLKLATSPQDKEKAKKAFMFKEIGFDLKEFHYEPKKGDIISYIYLLEKDAKKIDEFELHNFRNIVKRVVDDLNNCINGAICDLKIINEEKELFVTKVLILNEEDIKNVIENLFSNDKFEELFEDVENINITIPKLNLNKTIEKDELKIDENIIDF